MASMKISSELMMMDIYRFQYSHENFVESAGPALRLVVDMIILDLIIQNP